MEQNPQKEASGPTTDFQEAISANECVRQFYFTD